ncbi:TIGR04372 family glycosyltransferase [Humidesulfovibrio idahonensis]
MNPEAGMSVDELLRGADALRKSGKDELARALLRQILEQAPDNLAAGLRLTELEIAAGDLSTALETLAALWRHTRKPEVGDLLAELGLEAARSQRAAQQDDRKVVERLAGLLRALHGPDKILVDTLQYDIIGGLAIDATVLVPIFKAGLAERTGKSVVFFSGQSANPALVEMLGRELPVFCDESFPRLMPLCGYDWDKGRYALKPEFARLFFGRHAALFADLVEFTHSTNGRAYCRTPEEGSMGMRLPEPQVGFSPEEEALGERFLRETLGVSADGWFVCLYARDGAYYNESPASPNWFRNSDIGTFLPAVNEILARGGHVVRIGERTSQALSHPDPRFLDYSNSPWRTPLLDLYLLAKCRFLLGTPSGLCHVAYSFRTPELMVNTVNVCIISSTDLYIPKLPRDTRTGQVLPFGEFLERFYGYGDIGLFLENGVNQRNLLHVEYQDNTPEEIRAAAAEMLDRLDGRYAEQPEAARLRERYRALWTPRAPHMRDTPIAASFLLAHPEILGPETPQARQEAKP